MRKFYLILLLFIAPAYFAQTNFEFLPSGLNFLPLRANNQEAKMGVLYYPNNNNLKLDIGNSVDLLSFQFPQTESKLNLGIEFMAYAKVIGYQQQRLQIDAIDGLFGGNLTYLKKYSSNSLSFRLRVIHNSAHLVDGDWFATSFPFYWSKPGGPMLFTKDFIELIAAHILAMPYYNIRYYGGPAYAYRVRPSALQRFSGCFGLEVNSDKIFGEVFEKPANIFIASHFNLAGVPKYSLSNQTQLGVKFGNWNGKGINFYLSYFTGNDFFGEYYNVRVSKFGIGFMVDF
jgi:hypothetical protein